MSPVRVVTDSSCDVPDHVAAEHQIIVVPLTIRFGDEEFVDRRDLTPAEFWDRVARSPVLPETAAPSPGAFEEAFRRAAAEGADGIVCITLSGALSATLQSAELAAKAVADVVPVRVVDSKFVTMALGNMCIEAARMAESGKGLDDIAGAVEDLVGRTRLYATLDTLENLKKGGRIGGAAAFLGSMLSIKPVIQLVDGKVEEESKQRTRTRSLRYIADKVREHGKVENLAVLQADAPDIDDFLALLADTYPRDEILVTQIGAVIGAHSGPRAIGVAFHVPR